MNPNLSAGQFFPGVYTPPERIREIGAALPGEGYEHRAVVRSLASSTVPARHLSGLGSIATNDPQAQEQGAVSGYYREVWADPGQEVGKPSIGLAGSFRGAGQAERAKHQYGLLHEIGHHAHAERNESDFLFGNNGRNEGLADNFASAHHTARPRHESTYAEDAERRAAGSVGEKRWARSYQAARRKDAMPDRVPRKRAMG
jgi:hypothetical protein